MDKAVFDELRKLIYDLCGISLSESKQALVSTRVGQRLRKLEINSEREYLDYLKGSQGDDEFVNLIDTISTNVTFFFRENDHFEVLKKVVKEKIDQGKKRFRFWSSASSTGEEPYSMAMTIAEAATGKSLDIKILATDISTRVLDICRQGIYEEEKLEKVPRPYVQKYFTKKKTGTTTVYEIKPAIRSMLTFKRLNLSAPPFPMKGPMDAIFCRNVMIYFDDKTRQNLLSEFERLMASGSYLMIGHSESVSKMLKKVKTVAPSTYCMP